MTNFMNSEKREKLIIDYGKLCKAKPLTGCIYKKKWDCAVFFFLEGWGELCSQRLNERTASGLPVHTSIPVGENAKYLAEF